MIFLMSPILNSLRAFAEKAGRSYAFFDEPGEPSPAVSVIGDSGDVEMRVIGPLLSGYNFDRQEIEARLDAVQDLGTINVIVDSPGGLLDAGVSLYQVLNRRRKRGYRVKGMVEGLAASAAVFPLLAADVREIEPGSKMMIHRPWTAVFSAVMGDRDELEASKATYSNLVDDQIQSLDAGQGQLEELLLARTSMSSDAIRSALGGGNFWFNTEQALDAGLVDAIAGDPSASQEPTNDDVNDALIDNIRANLISNYLRTAA